MRKLRSLWLCLLLATVMPACPNKAADTAGNFQLKGNIFDSGTGGGGCPEGCTAPYSLAEEIYFLKKMAAKMEISIVPVEGTDEQLFSFPVTDGKYDCLIQGIRIGTYDLNVRLLDKNEVELFSGGAKDLAIVAGSTTEAAANVDVFDHFPLVVIMNGLPGDFSNLAEDQMFGTIHDSSGLAYKARYSIDNNGYLEFKAEVPIDFVGSKIEIVDNSGKTIEARFPVRVDSLNWPYLAWPYGILVGYAPADDIGNLDLTIAFPS